jgi:glycosyltransferase involved in cell wall biosynthesis
MSIENMAAGYASARGPSHARPADVTPMPVRRGVHLSVVVPICNEEAELLRMAEGLAPHLDEIAGCSRWQFVLVDNGSRDNSAALCDDIVRRWPQSIKLRLPRPNYGEALYQGLMRAAGPWAFIINVDFWDAPFMRWCFKTRGVYDLVMGSKRADHALNQQDNYRRLLSWGLNTILQTTFGFVGSDTHGQKFLYLPALRPIFQSCVMRRGQFDTEFTLRASRAQLWLAEVPVPIVELRKPRNLMFNKIVRNFVDIRRLHRQMRNVPVRAGTRYHRWSREDVERLDSAQTELIIEMGRLHRGAALPADSSLEPAAQIRELEESSRRHFM